MRSTLQASARGRSFGRLAEIASWVAACQDTHIPEPFSRPRAVIVPGNHGIAHRGLSAHSVGAARVQATEIAAGGGPVNVAARAAGCSVRLVDDWVDVATPSVDESDAMTREQVEGALRVGCSVVDQEIDAGTDVIVPGDLGAGNTTIASILYGVLTATEPVAAIGRGSGINDEAWKVKVAVIRDAMFRARALRSDIPGLLAAVTSPDFVTLVGVIAQSAVRRTPVVLDGPYSVMAAHCAELLAPGTKKWLLAGQLGTEPCQPAILSALEVTPIMALDIATGQGTGALLALPVINAAAEMVGDELRVLEGAR